jgi:hypothetical protein
MDARYAGYSTAVVITPSDTAAQSYRAIYVGGAGNVALVPEGQSSASAESAVTFTAVVLGTILPVSCKKVMNTNTTATLLIGLN